MSAETGIEVIYAEAGRAWRTTLAAASGLTCGEALARLRAQAPHWPAAAFAPAAFAVFGREVGPDAALRPGDRLELLRALPTDPKRARRARAETTKPR
jgi:hypothetical protein